MLIITADIIADFRAYMPGFTDATAWPDATVTRYLEEADEETGRRWGSYPGRASLKKRGMFNYAAHKMTLANIAANVTGNGGVASAPAVVSGKSVGNESISYAVATPTPDQADGYGDLQTTIYGREFLRLRRRAGMGAVVV